MGHGLTLRLKFIIWVCMKVPQFHFFRINHSDYYSHRLLWNFTSSLQMWPSIALKVTTACHFSFNKIDFFKNHPRPSFWRCSLPFSHSIMTLFLEYCDVFLAISDVTTLFLKSFQNSSNDKGNAVHFEQGFKALKGFNEPVREMCICKTTWSSTEEEIRNIK